MIIKICVLSISLIPLFCQTNSSTCHSINKDPDHDAFANDAGVFIQLLKDLPNLGEGIASSANALGWIGDKSGIYGEAATKFLSYLGTIIETAVDPESEQTKELKKIDNFLKKHMSTLARDSDAGKRDVKYSQDLYEYTMKTHVALGLLHFDFTNWHNVKISNVSRHEFLLKFMRYAEQDATNPIALLEYMEKSMANCRRPAAKSEMLKQRADKILQSISRHLNKIQRGKTSHNTATSTLLKKRDKFYTQFKAFTFQLKQNIIALGIAEEVLDQIEDTLRKTHCTLRTNLGDEEDGTSSCNVFSAITTVLEIFDYFLSTTTEEYNSFQCLIESVADANEYRWGTIEQFGQMLKSDIERLKLYAFTKIKYEEWTNETKALERKQVVSTVKKITAKAKNWMDGLQDIWAIRIRQKVWEIVQKTESQSDELPQFYDRIAIKVRDFVDIHNPCVDFFHQVIVLDDDYDSGLWQVYKHHYARTGGNDCPVWYGDIEAEPSLEESALPCLFLKNIETQRTGITVNVMISYFKRNDATIYHRAKNGNKWFNESSTKIGEILYNGAELDIPTTEAHLKQLIEKIDEKTGADLEYDGFKFRNVLLIEDMVAYAPQLDFTTSRVIGHHVIGQNGTVSMDIMRYFVFGSHHNFQIYFFL